MMTLILTIIAIIGFIGTLPQFWGYSWKDVYRYALQGSVPWDTVHEATLKLLQKITTLGFNPTVVVGIGRGGILAAGLLCSEITRSKLIVQSRQADTPHVPALRIGTMNTKVIFKSQVDEKSGRQRSLVDRIDVEEIDCTIQPEDRVLLILAQNFTGATLEKAVSLIVARGVLRENVVTAALFWQKPRLEQHHIPDAHEPDMFGMILAPTKTMPWKSKDVSTNRV
ncbi:hypothetical protein KAU37_13220 [Candidatus Bipolaricaulota bacterium]|nr:hypothetical protein [Candidatus Bipolaricaulota bacterium]